MIPKIIHYCWFGGREYSPLIKACMRTWKKLEQKGYIIKEWNESNCDLSENLYVKQMYAKKRYAFVSDYFRLKALYEEGGIYLDSDVFVYKNFDDLLDCDLFMGYIYDCALGTAVIGAKKNCKIIKNLLEGYSEIGTEEIINNGLVTEYFHNSIDGFVLNGKRSSIIHQGERIEIFSKDEFEAGKIMGRSHTLHFCDNSWNDKIKKKVNFRLKLFCCRLPINLVSYRRHRFAEKYLREDGKYQSWYNIATGKHR